MAKNKKKVFQTSIQTSLLEKAIEQTPDVKGHFCKGLGALNSAAKTKISVPDTTKLTGSLDIDKATKDKYPEDNRWDYAVEYDNETFFIEVHPGSTGEVTKVIAKLNWLKNWLKEKAPEIRILKPADKRAFYWLYTNNFSILPNSKYALMLSSNGIKPTKNWDYKEISKSKKK